MRENSRMKLLFHICEQKKMLNGETTKVLIANVIKFGDSLSLFEWTRKLEEQKRVSSTMLYCKDKTDVDCKILNSCMFLEKENC